MSLSASQQILKKFIPYIVGAIIAIQAMTPPFEFGLRLIDDKLRFVWIFLVFGVLAFYFIFTKASIWLKILIPYVFINSFITQVPTFSMISAIWVILCAYFYLLCLEIDNWDTMVKIVSAVLCVEFLTVVLESFGKDTLLNFYQVPGQGAGTIANSMQLKAFIFIAMAFLIAVGKPKILKKNIWVTGTFIFCWALGYLIVSHKIADYLYARGPVAVSAVALWCQHPVIGWGVGTFKGIFPTLAHGHFSIEGQWTHAHNTFVEILFELGIIGYYLFIGYCLSLFTRAKGFLTFAMIIVGVVMSMTFPDRQTTVVPILILFTAYADLQARKHLKELEG